MHVTAAATFTVRLALDVRDLELARKYAEILVRTGFRVVHVAARGITFEGQKAELENMFQSCIEDDDAPKFLRDPVLPDDLREHVASVYLPNKPQFLTDKNGDRDVRHAWRSVSRPSKS